MAGMKKRHLDLLATDLKKYRRIHHYSMDDITALTGLAKSTIYSVESDSRSVINVETIEALAALFNMEAAIFFVKYVALSDVSDEKGTKKDP